MRSALERVPSTYLAVFVAAADATVWLAALPFELYCKRIIAGGHPPTPFLFLILVVNALLLGLMVSAVGATGELVRRGLTPPGRAFARLFVRDRSRPSEY